MRIIYKFRKMKNIFINYVANNEQNRPKYRVESIVCNFVRGSRNLHGWHAQINGCKWKMSRIMYTIDEISCIRVYVKTSRAYVHTRCCVRRSYAIGIAIIRILGIPFR